MNKNNILITVLIAIITLGAGFWCGSAYQKSKQPTFGIRNGQANFVMNRNVNGQRNGGLGGNRPIVGEITAIEDKSITIKMPDGSSKIVIISTSTKISKTSDGSKTDLQNGTEVSVLGSTGNDGTITAQNIFIGGGFFQGMRGSLMPAKNN